MVQWKALPYATIRGEGDGECPVGTIIELKEGHGSFQLQLPLAACIYV